MTSRTKEQLEKLRLLEEEDKKFQEQAQFILQKQKLDRIEYFQEFFDFLNNDYPCEIIFEKLTFRSVSHAFQAARTDDQVLQEKMANAETPMEVYQIAIQLDDPENWQQKRLIIMEQLCRDKFRRSKDLRERLKATGTRELWNSYEDSTPSNLYWGMVQGKGQNQLGRILEQIRFDVQNNLELKKWIMTNNNVQNNKELIPRIQMSVFKNGEKLEEIDLKNQTFYLFGRASSNFVVLQHPSVSTHHAAIVITEDQGPVIIDLESRGKTFIDLTEIQPHVAYQLKPDSSLNFAFSTRKYNVKIDYSYVQRHIEILQKSIKQDMKTLQKLNNNPDSQTILESLNIIQNKTILIKNLPFTTSQKEIHNLFKDFGEVKDIRMPIDRQSGSLKGIAFLTFEKSSSIEKSLSRDGYQLRDRRLRVQIAEDRLKSKSRSRSRDRKKRR